MKLSKIWIFSVLLSLAGCSSQLCGDTDLVSLASYDECTRLLLLDGDDGTVACRIYGTLLSATFPRYSDNWTLESATRSLLRMNNLTAVRGVPGASMAGPLDYLGNLEDQHKYLYTIQGQSGFPPVFHRTSLIDKKPEPLLAEFDNNLVTVVKAHWISGEAKDEIQEKNLEYNVTPKHLKQSLFLNPGFLEIDRKLIELKDFDPRGVDLSSFRARLVDHSIPFQITDKKLPSKDDYRLVTYLFEPHYANWQIQHGSGLFLEKHLFSQTITPLTGNSKGFVALARTNEKPDELELVGIQIPYGHTLIIEEECIHGDTTLTGFFMMGMTSYHTTMQTADTVFLKYPETKENVGMLLVGASDSSDLTLNPPPYVIYRDATEQDRATFRRLTEGENFVFNPFSREYWKR